MRPENGASDAGFGRGAGELGPSREAVAFAFPARNVFIASGKMGTFSIPIAAFAPPG